MRLFLLIGAALAVTVVALGGCNLPIGLIGVGEGEIESSTISGKVYYEGSVPRGAVLYITAAGSSRSIAVNVENPMFPQEYVFPVEEGDTYEVAAVLDMNGDGLSLDAAYNPKGAARNLKMGDKGADITLSLESAGASSPPTDGDGRGEEPGEPYPSPKLPYYPTGMDKVDEYDPATDTWTAKKPMPSSREGFSLAVVGNKVYALGGYGFTDYGTSSAVDEYDPASDTWSTKAPIPISRSGFQTAVSSGKIHILGGYRMSDYDYSPASEVEAYDPAKDTWETKASMPTKRDGFGVAVANDKIYVLGGYDLDTVAEGGDLDSKDMSVDSYYRPKLLTTVEEYDPSTDTWTAKKPMPTSRSGFKVAAVSGKIYVLGGYGDLGPVDTAEEYDPETGNWRNVAPMPKPDYFDLIVAAGKIYVFGGYGEVGILTPEAGGVAKAELYPSPQGGAIHEYDPAKDSWKTLPPMLTPRQGFVLATAGDKIYAFGGYSSLCATPGAEEYDPAAGTWKKVSSPAVVRNGFKAVAVDGKIYVMGGYEIPIPKIPGAVALEYDPATNTWTKKSAMPSFRQGFRTEVVNGKLYVIGRRDLCGPAEEVYEYDPAADKWTTKSSMPVPLGRFVTVVAGGKIYVGGHSFPKPYNSTEASTVFEEYDPAGDLWKKKSAPTKLRTDFGIAVANGKIYVIGGYDGFYPVSTVEEYDPATDTWTARANMARRRGVHTEVVNGKIYVLGGETDLGPVADVREYDTSATATPADTWTEKKPIPTLRIGFGTATVGGKIYVISGFGGFYPVGTVEVYDPTNDSWTEAAPTPAPSEGLTALVVGGKIYTLGGRSAFGGPPKFVEYDPANNAWTEKAPIPGHYSGIEAEAVGSKIYVLGSPPIPVGRPEGGSPPPQGGDLPPPPGGEGGKGVPVSARDIE